MMSKFKVLFLILFITGSLSCFNSSSMRVRNEAALSKLVTLRNEMIDLQNENTKLYEGLTSNTKTFPEDDTVAQYKYLGGRAYSVAKNFCDRIQYRKMELIERCENVDANIAKEILSNPNLIKNKTAFDRTANFMGTSEVVSGDRLVNSLKLEWGQLKSDFLPWISGDSLLSVEEVSKTKESLNVFDTLNVNSITWQEYHFANKTQLECLVEFTDLQVKTLKVAKEILLHVQKKMSFIVKELQKDWVW